MRLAVQLKDAAQPSEDQNYLSMAPLTFAR